MFPAYRQAHDPYRGTLAGPQPSDQRGRKAGVA